MTSWQWSVLKALIRLVLCRVLKLDIKSNILEEEDIILLIGALER